MMPVQLPLKMLTQLRQLSLQNCRLQLLQEPAAAAAAAAAPVGSAS
jgi:hypothetical protein